MDIDYDVSGGNVFNMQVVTACIDKLIASPPKAQHVTLEWPKNVSVAITSPDRREWFLAARKWSVAPRVAKAGPLLVWRPPFSCRNKSCRCEGTGAHTYVIGGDTSRNVGSGDDGAIGVLDCTAGMLVARWKGKVDTEEFGDICVRLAKWYGVNSGADRNPWIGVEWNDVGTNANEYLDKMGMALVRTPTWDRVNKRIENKLGIVTSPTTKPQLIDKFLYPFISKAVSESGLPLLYVPDMEFWKQCETYVTHESNIGHVRPDRPKMGATIGDHDDLIMMMSFCIFTAIQNWGKVKGHVRAHGLAHWRENPEANQKRDKMLEEYERQATLLTQ